MALSGDAIIAMARDAIIAMARDANPEHDLTAMLPFLSRFAALVAAKEREACAQAREEVARKYEERHRGCYPDGMVPAEMGADDCVEVIRAMGKP